MLKNVMCFVAILMISTGWTQTFSSDSLIHLKDNESIFKVNVAKQSLLAKADQEFEKEMN
ncbi:MAG: hypothetical protein GF313_10655, partial [Caldithrix sp.]|nr:hypothetical protein [Caldithrix sp.]